MSDMEIISRRGLRGRPLRANTTGMWQNKDSLFFLINSCWQQATEQVLLEYSHKKLMK